MLFRILAVCVAQFVGLDTLPHNQMPKGESWIQAYADLAIGTPHIQFLRFIQIVLTFCLVRCFVHLFVRCTLWNSSIWHFHPAVACRMMVCAFGLLALTNTPYRRKKNNIKSKSIIYYVFVTKQKKKETNSVSIQRTHTHTHRVDNQHPTLNGSQLNQKISYWLCECVCQHWRRHWIQMLPCPSMPMFTMSQFT